MQMEKSILEVSTKKDVGTQSLITSHNRQAVFKFFELINSLAKANSRLPLLLRVFSTPFFTLSTTLFGALFFLAFSLKKWVFFLLYRRRIYNLMLLRASKLKYAKMHELLSSGKKVEPAYQPIETENLTSSLRSISSERNYLIRHTRESLDEFSIIVMSQIYSVPGARELKDASKYWARKDSPSSEIKAILRSIRLILLTNRTT
ncbi:hypothetical protein DSO57_1031738 [Entomophthora muscae]|uniref:Uncharacterized protein n=2 Tax=Entomophthora muscae TaxID=34485 RepID=A0ACC2TYG8_9FUNG|nr:hypothetical protein DSO57_1031738 [Entomophthora muscae]